MSLFVNVCIQILFCLVPKFHSFCNTSARFISRSLRAEIIVSLAVSIAESVFLAIFSDAILAISRTLSAYF